MMKCPCRCVLRSCMNRANKCLSQKGPSLRMLESLHCESKERKSAVRIEHPFAMDEARFSWKRRTPDFCPRNLQNGTASCNALDTKRTHYIYNMATSAEGLYYTASNHPHHQTIPSSPCRYTSQPPFQTAPYTEPCSPTSHTTKTPR